MESRDFQKLTRRFGLYFPTTGLIVPTGRARRRTEIHRWEARMEIPDKEWAYRFSMAVLLGNPERHARKEIGKSGQRTMCLPLRST
jgi:hypothetical protein